MWIDTVLNVGIVGVMAFVGVNVVRYAVAVRAIGDQYRDAVAVLTADRPLRVPEASPVDAAPIAQAPAVVVQAAEGPPRASQGRVRG